MPLVAIVGIAREEIFRQSDETLRHYIVAGTVLTAIVLTVMVLGAAGRARLLSTTAELQFSKQSMEQSNLLLHTALANMATACRCSTTTCVSSCATIATFKCMVSLRHNKARRDAASRYWKYDRRRHVAEGHERIVRTRLEKRQCQELHIPHIETKLTDGRVVAVNYQPMATADGWLSITTSPHKETERALVESTEALTKSNARFAAALQNMSQAVRCSTRNSESSSPTSAIGRSTICPRTW